MDYDQLPRDTETGLSGPMTDLFKTQQECLWHGNFGDDYTVRNAGALNANLALFGKILSRTDSLNSVIEFGSNIGLNLLAIDMLAPACRKTAVEINSFAVEQLKKFPEIEIFNESALDFETDRQWDMVLTKGLLIHTNPRKLSVIYDKLFSCSMRYICLAEYYNPTPVTVSYRGHSDHLFKRDFAGELLDRFPSIRLIDYGFCYHRDNNFPHDDITWFLLQKADSNRR